ncbi:SAM-dependent DNA methyltransferase [Apilactobacillus micheneri]|uniref:HsdM family class I SAM-dependent methyltransferase n=1 Tax=Apilactobacillus micheneri TaxID=1899430 RepID=UPI001125FB9C|nr:N-6 DNA methylase [Apilactobacillus micheneri]TPR42316.1 SAM-dependent DNA methyltransferase [Apilactobacillus micheneri]TPR47009.1 SAM-dependent DNA methyltransferase [Apilactobacillus micheneri]
MNNGWKLEEQLNDWLKLQFRKHNFSNYTIESNMSDKMKESLKGAAKTSMKSNFGKPDFEIECYDIPIIIENKLDLNKLKKENKNGLKMDQKSVNNYADNGALYYAQNMISSGLYQEVIAIGLAGNNKNDTEMDVYYVFGSNTKPKYMYQYKKIDFLESKEAFNDFLNNARLTDVEKHQILINTSQDLNKKAKTLNVLMNNLNITASNRVIYVSGNLLAMQNIVDTHNDQILGDGLTPEDLHSSTLPGSTDGDLITTHIKQYLDNRQLPDKKVNLMIHSFETIKNDPDRERPVEIQKQVSKFFSKKSSINKQIFTFIYENVFKAIDGTNGHLDIMGTMYSEFLKYALGDGKGIGIVLTPPYITKMMTDILNVNMNSRVMDLATGSAGFLISSMTTMINNANKVYGRSTKSSQKKIEEIKHNQLLGVELNPEMFTLAATNMILRGDGSSNIQKGDSFNLEDHDLYNRFQPTKLLLNPPFSFKENGMPFIEYGMRYMGPDGMAAIIVQDSAGSGQAISTNKKILKNNTLMYSIKMPNDLFEPSAGVQTSIYVFRTGIPHDFDKTVRFIDFRNDGYKRTARSINEIDSPITRYQDILKIVKAGRNAKLGNHSKLWNLNTQVFDEQINDSGSDWNFEQHQVIDTTPHEKDFLESVGSYLNWEIDELLKEEKNDKI